MKDTERYTHLNEYLKNKFGERVLKICIDGGFTCPNRDGSMGTGGCIFCGERGSGEHIKTDKNLAILESIRNQVTAYFSSYKASRANKFIVYFQNFSNTYADIETLKERYNAALIDNRIVGISIATRPDCITEDIAKLLKLYTNKYYVSVELGLQTANETTGKLINRGYTNADFSNAVSLLRKYDIEVVAHMMVGLPGESLEDLIDTVNFLNSHDINGLKIHSTYVIKNTQLAEMYLSGKYEPITLEYYIEAVIFILEHIKKNIVIHRISGDAPKNLLLVPEWNLHKKWIINGITKALREKNTWQGKSSKKLEE